MIESKIRITAKNKTDRAFNEVNQNISKVSNNLLSAKSAFSGFIGVAAIAKLTDFAKSSIEFADAIAKTSDKLGISTDALQEYRFAADRSVVAQSVLDMGIQRFTRRLAEAATGTGVLNKVLTENNIKIRDSEGNLRSTEDVLKDYADAIQGAETSQEKLLLAFKAFDSEGAALVNVFRDGAAGLEVFQQSARDAGAVMDGELIRKAEIINARWDTLATTFGVKFRSAAVSVVDVFADSRAESVILQQEMDNLVGKLNRVEKASRDTATQWLNGLFGVSSKERIESIVEQIVDVSKKIADINQASDVSTIEVGNPDKVKEQTLTTEQLIFIHNQTLLANQRVVKEEEEEIEADSLERRRANLQAHLRQGEIDTRRDAQKRLAIEMNFNKQKQAAMASTFGTLSTLMSARSKELFKIGKVAAIASALINTSQAITRTMAETPYPWNIPLAAAQGLAGMAQVQNIRAQSFGGGGAISISGGGSSGAGLPTDRGINTPFNPFLDENTGNGQPSGGSVVINVFRPELLSDESMDKLAEFLAERVEDRDFILIRNGSRNALNLKES